VHCAHGEPPRLSTIGLSVIAVVVAACSSAAVSTTPMPSAAMRSPSMVPLDDPRLLLLRELPVGMCVNENIGPDGEGYGFLEVSCSEPHELEVFGIGEVDPTFRAYPDEEDKAAEQDRICRPLFESYVGRDYNSSIYIFWAYGPLTYLWPHNRTVVCMIGNAQRSLQEAGSAKGSRR